MDKIKFGLRLRMARKAKGLTPNEVAEIINLNSGDYYTKYELAHRTPTDDTMVDLCNLFDISPNFLYSDSLDKLGTFEDKILALQPHERIAVELLVDKLLEAAAQFIDYESTGREDIVGRKSEENNEK